MSNVMFEQTIRSLARFGDLSNQLKEMFHTQGLSAVANVLESKEGINYVGFPDGAFLHCCAYVNRISYDVFNASGAPLLHFCACEEFQRIYQSHNPHLLLIAPKHNAFEFSVYRGHNMVGWYADTPLRLCPMCKEMFVALWQSGKDRELLQSLQSALELPLE